MSRRIRQPIVVLFVFVLAAAVVAGTGAFSAITADRAAAVDMTADASSYLGMSPHSGPNGAYAEVDADGLVELRLTGGNQNIGSEIAGGTGVPGEATTLVEDVINVTNQGTQPVTVWITEDSDAVAFGTTTDGHGAIDEEANGFTLSPGQTMEVGLMIDTSGIAGEERLLESATAHAVAAGASVPDGDDGGAGPTPPSNGEAAFIVGTYHDWNVLSPARPGKAFAINSDVSGTVELSNADATFNGEINRDEAGESVDVAGDVNGDGSIDYLIGAQNHDLGVAYIVYGPVSGSIDLADADVTLEGWDITHGVGETVAGVGDINGDGLDDVLVGAPFADGSTGKAYLVYGSPTLGGEVNLSNANVTFIGESAGGGVGHSLAGAGDVNGDGFDDLLIGAPFTDNIGENEGATYLVYGAASLGGTMDLGNADAKYIGANPQANAGTSVAGGDVTGDGFADILIGARDANTTAGTFTGAAYLIHGGSGGSAPSGTHTLDAADVTYAGEGGHAGQSVAIPGDVNGDGIGDVLVGAPSGRNGTVYVEYGSATQDSSVDLATVDGTITGLGGDEFGTSLAGVGDIDGDGLNDFVVGAPSSDNPEFDTGAVYLFTGGTLSGDRSASEARAVLLGVESEDQTGWSVGGGA